MAGINLWNKIVAAASGNGWNLIQDLLTALNSANVIVPVASVTERNGLTPPAGKYEGMAVARQDVGGMIEVLDGDLSTWTRGIQHAEFTGSTVPDIPVTSPTWGTGALATDAPNSRNGAIFTSPSNDRFRLPQLGLYSVSVRVQMTAAATGKTWVAITNDAGTVTYTSYDIQPGTSTGAASIPNFYAAAAQNLRVVFYSETAPGYTLTSRIRVSRIG